MESNEGSIQIDDGSNWAKLSPQGFVVPMRWAWGENKSLLHNGSSTLCAIDKWRSPFSSVLQEYYVLIGQRVAGIWKNNPSARSVKFPGDGTSIPVRIGLVRAATIARSMVAG